MAKWKVTNPTQHKVTVHCPNSTYTIEPKDSIIVIDEVDVTMLNHMDYLVEELK